MASALEAVVCGVTDVDLRSNDLKMCLLCGQQSFTFRDAVVDRYYTCHEVPELPDPWRAFADRTLLLNE